MVALGIHAGASHRFVRHFFSTTLLIIAMACSLHSVAANAAASSVITNAPPNTAPDAALEARVEKIAERLRCLVCQNQSIAESQADLAKDLRRQVREMLVAGKPDADIIDFMVQRYGDFVLYDPPLKMTTILLWAGPATLMLLGLGGFAWALHQRRRNPTDANLSEAEHAAAQALLNDVPTNTNRP